MKITLGAGVQMDLDKAIESRVLIQANSGGGKSYTIRRFIEQAFGKKQIIVLDPEGEFANMRSKFDFVYAGPGGDAPVESRSAALLAKRLLELKASAIIDLYELPPQERKHFVKLFLDSMVNAPKELWTDCFVILDEAHIFAPEKDQSESLSAVIDMASRGRKRGFCLIPATQRPAKLNKDVAAECNNKLIGRASLDIDRKRAAEELGFTSREEILSLRDLEPGEFYAFGPAIGREVVKTMIGEVEVKPPKRGAARGHVPAPSAKVKAILANLADLPQEAKKEADTIQSLKTELAQAKREESSHKCPPTISPEMIRAEADKLVKKAYDDIEKAFDEELKRFRKKIATVAGHVIKLEAGIGSLRTFLKEFEGENVEMHIPKPVITVPKIIGETGPAPVQRAVASEGSGDGTIAKGEETILNAIAQYPGGITNEHIAILTGYKATSRRTYLQKLASAGYIRKDGENYEATQEGMNALGTRFEKLPTGRSLLEHWLTKLPEGEKKILQALYDADRSMSREEIEQATAYKATSVRTYVQKLSARKILVNEGGNISISPDLYR